MSVPQERKIAMKQLSYDLTKVIVNSSCTSDEIIAVLSELLHEETNWLLKGKHSIEEDE